MIYPLKPESGLDLNIDAHELNLKFLEFYMKSIAQDIKGRERKSTFLRKVQGIESRWGCYDGCFHEV